MVFMSQLLVEPTQQVELKASQILRMTKVDQCRNSYHLDGKFCAIGALMNWFGWNGYTGSDYNAIEFKKLNISSYIWSDIMHLNDTDGKSFDEIADWLEEKGL